MTEVDFVIPNEAKEQLLPLVSQGISSSVEDRKNMSKLPQDTKAVEGNKQSHFKSSAVFFDKASSEAQTRTFLKIQDGCNGFCTYCLIPYARGASTSVFPTTVMAEITRLVEQKTKEIVFTGIHIGDYGRDLKENEGSEESGPFVNLLSEALSLDGLKRIRISSLEPMEASEDLIKLLASYRDKSCDHFHLPLQSGNGRILKAMKRAYTTDQYAQSLELIRKYFPDANITADIIPGFPGETDEEFQSTLDFIQNVGLNGLHVFPYSKRPNTAAARMPHHIKAEVVKKRAAILRKLSSELEEKYARQYIGTRQQVLWETGRDEKDRLKGKTKNYLNVVSSLSAAVQPGLTSEVTLKGFIRDNEFLGI
jgi:threonylcarbamoyladenosine tRNA methylthiotransferase MtaB